MVAGSEIPLGMACSEILLEAGSGIREVAVTGLEIAEAVAMELVGEAKMVALGVSRSHSLHFEIETGQEEY